MPDISITTIVIFVVLLILAFMLYTSAKNTSAQTNEPYAVSEEQETQIVEAPIEDVYDDNTVNVSLNLTNPYYDSYTGYPYWGYGTSYYSDPGYGSYGYHPRYDNRGNRGHWGGHLRGYSSGYGGGHRGGHRGGHGGGHGGGHRGGGGRR